MTCLGFRRTLLLDPFTLLGVTLLQTMSSRAPWEVAIAAMNAASSSSSSSSSSGGSSYATYASSGPPARVPYTGMTAKQFDYASTHYADKGFVADASRVGNYSDVQRNVADRQWQEMMRSDPSYSWGSSDKASYRKNSDYGAHNAASEHEKAVYGGK